MTQDKKLVDMIVEGLQDGKASKIVVVDLTGIENHICEYMVICEGNSNTHVNYVATNLKEYVRNNYGEKPIAMEGSENSEWIVADYSDIMVHIMQREPRAFYDLEHLWEDAETNEIPEL